MTMVRSATAIAGAAVSALALVGSGSAAWGATDTTPPVLNLPTSAAFTVGYQVSDTDYASNDMSAYTRVKETLRWDANDPSGICSYDVAHEIAYGTYGWIDGTQATSVSDTIDDYDGTYGGGAGELYGWDVTAHDCAGNTTTKFIGEQPLVVNEDGTYPDGTTTAPVFSAGWIKAYCACFTGGTAKRSYTRGAWVTYSRTFTERDNHLAVVMSKGPARGKFAVYLDGTYRKTVDTYRASNIDRIVTWQGYVGSGTHTVKLVNLATSGRPYIHVDAFLSD